MNVFDELYEIRQATIEDENKIMTFLDEKWRKGHILATSKELLEYEFRDGNMLNFLIALDRDNQDIVALQGFLYCSSAEPKKRDIWGSIWKVDEKRVKAPFLGVELEKRIKKLTECRSLLGNGANPATSVPLHEKILKDKVVKLEHFYRLNSQMDDFKIAKIEEIPRSLEKTNDSHVDIRKIEDEKELDRLVNIGKYDGYPYKDNWYVKKRFFRYPWYKYNVYVLGNGQEYDAILVTRVQKYQDRQILRVVDYIGERKHIAGLEDFFAKQFRDGGYEYIDFYEYGIEPEYLESAGFTNRYEDHNIIPNYFGPFLQQNIDIWSHCSLKDREVIFTKADADQDRPNCKEND